MRETILDRPKYWWQKSGPYQRLPPLLPNHFCIPSCSVRSASYITSSSSSSSRNTLKWQPDSPFPYSSLEGVGPVKMSEMGARSRKGGCQSSEGFTNIAYQSHQIPLKLEDDKSTNSKIKCAVNAVLDRRRILKRFRVLVSYSRFIFALSPFLSFFFPHVFGGGSAAGRHRRRRNDVASLFVIGLPLFANVYTLACFYFVFSKMTGRSVKTCRGGGGGGGGANTQDFY